MKKEDAIKRLQSHIDLLKTIKVDDVWVGQARSMVKDYLGEDSSEYDFIKKYKLGYSITFDSSWEQYFIKKNKEDCTRFLQGCIEKISINGLHKSPKVNFLQRLNNGQAIGLIVTISIFLLGGAILGGKEWGQRNSDVQNIELRQEIKELNQKTDDLLKQKAALEQQIKKLQNP